MLDTKLVVWALISVSLTGWLVYALKRDRSLTTWLERLLWLLIRVGLFGLVFCIVQLVLGFFPTDDYQAVAFGAPRARATLFLMVAWMLTGLVLLYKLVAIVQSLGKGDPFVSENSRRLRWIAWAVFVGEGVRGGMQWAGPIDAPGVLVQLPPGNWTPIWSLVIVLMLFALARVFEQGARMREEIGEMI